MKFLADMNMSMGTVTYLRGQGHDVVHLRDQGLERLPDAGVVDKARNEGRVILTFDLDFGDLMAAGQEELPSVIIFRMNDETPAAVKPRLVDVLERCENELVQGALLVVDERRIRVRRLPLTRNTAP